MRPSLDLVGTLAERESRAGSELSLAVDRRAHVAQVHRPGRQGTGDGPKQLRQVVRDAAVQALVSRAHAHSGRTPLADVGGAQVSRERRQGHREHEHEREEGADEGHGRVPRGHKNYACFSIVARSEQGARRTKHQTPWSREKRHGTVLESEVGLRRPLVEMAGIEPASRKPICKLLFTSHSAISTTGGKRCRPAVNFDRP